MSPRFVMISRWRLKTSRQRLWELLVNPTDWPAWWPQLAAVRRLANGDSEGIGSRHEFLWRSGLGYGLRVAMTTLRVEHCRELEGEATGDLRGIGLWIIENDVAGALRLTYRWDVELGKPWMRRLARPLGSLFAWRHFAVMAGGAHGMARQLGCRLSNIEEWSAITTIADGAPAG